MLKLYSVNGERIDKTDNGNLKDAVWIDLLMPTAEEEKSVESFFKLDIPTREEMGGIELSNRFYEENGVLYMTVTVLAKAESGDPEKHAVTMLLTKDKLITARYVDTHSFKIFESRLNKCDMGGFQKEYLLSELLEAFINRLADIVEMIDSRVDEISHKVFRQNAKTEKKKDKKRFYNLLTEIGLCGDLLSKCQESLISIMRLIAFLQPHLNDEMRGKMKHRLQSIDNDTAALRAHNDFMIDKITFLQDGTLGLINIQQNDIMKIFSIAAVCFVPSTIITGFFGMNFKNMPEYDLLHGQYWALGLMALSLIISFLMFWRKGWF